MIRDYFPLLSSPARNTVRKPLHFSLVNCTLCCIVRPVYSSRPVSLSRRVPLHLPAPIHSATYARYDPPSFHPPLSRCRRQDGKDNSFVYLPPYMQTVSMISISATYENRLLTFLIKENVSNSGENAYLFFTLTQRAVCYPLPFGFYLDQSALCSFFTYVERSPISIKMSLAFPNHCICNCSKASLKTRLDNAYAEKCRENVIICTRQCGTDENRRNIKLFLTI